MHIQQISFLFFLITWTETREVAQSLNRFPRLVTITEYIDTAHNAPRASSPLFYFLPRVLPPTPRDTERATNFAFLSPTFSSSEKSHIVIISEDETETKEKDERRSRTEKNPREVRVKRWQEEEEEEEEKKEEKAEKKKEERKKEETRNEKSWTHYSPRMPS